jgi:integrase
MAVRKICTQKGCRASPRCGHPWWFDVMHQGKRWRMPVDDFALPRGATEPITSKQTAERVWEPKFLGDCGGTRSADPADDTAGGSGPDRRGVPGPLLHQLRRGGGTAQLGFDPRAAQSGKRSLGDLPIAALEKPSEILRFRAEYRHGHEVASVNRALSVLRAAINWGRFQDPPVLSTSPFHRFAVSIKAKEETKRDRRIGLQEEQRLLATALEMNSAGHRFVGPSMHDRIVGALETCCRQGEMLRIKNRHVDWEQHQIAIPGSNAKDAENRRIPFDPHGRLAPILKRRSALGPNAFVFGSSSGEFLAGFKTAWESLLLLANGHDTKRAKPGARVDRAKLHQIDLHWHDMRHEGACRLLADGVDIRTIQLMLGHADIKQTQRYLNITDEELRKAMTGVWERRRQLRAVGN